MEAIDYLRGRVQALFEPGILMGYAVCYLFITIFEVIFIERKPLKLFHLNEIRSQAFSRLWLAVSPSPDSAERPPDDPNSPFASLPSYLSAVSGVILDIGPGSGTFTPYFTSPSITAVYGAEPTTGLHDALRKTAKVAGLDTKYHVLGCGGERESLLPALVKAGLLKGGKVEGIFDTIVCLRVLCSVPDPEASLKTLYSLLRPGGRFIIAEHVVNDWRTPKGSVSARAMQAVYSLMGWSFFMGDCRLYQDTVGILKRVGEANGGWETVEVERKNESSVLPWAIGQFVKSRDSTI